MQLTRSLSEREAEVEAAHRVRLEQRLAKRKLLVQRKKAEIHRWATGCCSASPAQVGQDRSAAAVALACTKPATCGGAGSDAHGSAANSQQPQHATQRCTHVQLDTWDVMPQPLQ